jgi:hypothetical protein
MTIENKLDMIKYINDTYNIILPKDYAVNLNSFEFSKFIEVVNPDDTFEVIQKEYHKDFYNSIIDRDIEPRWGYNLLDELVEFNSPYDFFILNLVEILDQQDIGFYEFLLNFIDVLDTDANKFSMLLQVHSMKVLVVKVKRFPRNVGRFPFIENRQQSLIYFLEDVNYNSWL